MLYSVPQQTHSQQDRSLVDAKKYWQRCWRHDSNACYLRQLSYL